MKYTQYIVIQAILKKIRDVEFQKLLFQSPCSVLADLHKTVERQRTISA